jgi:RNA polymerase sigma-70 factor (ECF subfamily)
MSAWLTTILRNLFRTEYRKRRREVEDADGRHVDSLKSPPEQTAGWNSRNLALAMLPSGQREALLLVGASGFSYDEAAAICESAVGTIPVVYLHSSTKGPAAIVAEQGVTLEVR